MTALSRLTLLLLLLLLLFEFLTSQLWLGNIHLSWDVIINGIRLGGLICSLKSFSQLNICQESQIFAFVYTYYVFGCRLSLVRLCDSDFGILPYYYYYYYYYYYSKSKRLAMAWTTLGSNSGGGEIFRTRPARHWGPTTFLYDGYRFTPGGKAAGAWR